MSKRKRKSTPKMFNRAIMESDVSVSHDIVVCNGIDGFVSIKVDKLTLDGCIKRKYLTAINLRLDKKASIEVLAELSDLVRLLKFCKNLCHMYVSIKFINPKGFGRY